MGTEEVVMGVLMDLNLDITILLLRTKMDITNREVEEEERVQVEQRDVVVIAELTTTQVPLIMPTGTGTIFERSTLIMC